MTQKALLQRQIPQGVVKNSNNSLTPLCWFLPVAVLLHPPESLEGRGVISRRGSLAWSAPEGD